MVLRKGRMIQDIIAKFCLNPSYCCLLSDCCQKINVSDKCMDPCVNGDFQSVYKCEADYSKILTCASGMVWFFPIAFAFSIWWWYNVFAIYNLHDKWTFYINFTCLYQMGVTTPPAVRACKFLRPVWGSVRGTWSLPQVSRPCVSTTSPAMSSASWMEQVSIK